MTSYLPMYFCLLPPNCTPCATYQMAYFMKHDAPQKMDFECASRGVSRGARRGSSRVGAATRPRAGPCYAMLCRPYCSK